MKRLLFLSLLLIIATVLIAKPVSTGQAIRVAENWMLERTGTQFSNSTVSPLKLNSPILVVSLRPTGYVLVAGDDASYPVIGYNTSHAWGEYTIPIQLQDMLQNWQDQLRDIVARQLPASEEIIQRWSHYDVPQAQFSPEGNYRAVTPLIQSTWGQEGYYNDLCPANTPVGCVATAMCQIMKYWSFPTIGNGSHSYNHPTYGTLSANFGGTTYNWAGMPNQVGSSNISVATVCFHAGVAVNMDYNPTGSGAYSYMVPTALENYFKYQSTAELKYKSNYSDANWHTLMQGELNNARPIYYAGSGSGGGHAFILDGWQNTNHYHFNWGWDGYYNGYYYLTALNPGGNNFTNSQEAVIGIQPTAGAVTYLNEGFEGTVFPPEGWTIANNDGGNTWVRNTTSTYVHTGSACASILYNATAHDDWLITPRLTPTADNHTLSFWARNRSSTYIDRFNVKLSTTTNDITSFTVNLASNVGPGTTYTQYTYNLGAYVGSDVYVAIQAISADMWQLFVDDVVGPPLWQDPNPAAALNITAWDAGNTQPGSSSSSGNIFQLSNQGHGTLTITSVTNLSGTEFSTTLNTGVALVSGQIHEFGFAYDPLNYGSDSQSFQIVTNGGTLTINLSGSASADKFGDGFETYADFTQDISPWTQYDGDGSATYSIQNYTFPNQGYTGSFIVFNSSQTSPPLNDTPMDAYSGYKGAYCFAATTPPNNDWLITPRVDLTGPTCSVSFWAKAYSSSYPEWFKVLYSTTTNAVSSFTNYLAGSATSHVVATTTWTQYTYTLPVTAKYVAIQCVSNDAFIFMVDSFLITDSGYNPPTPTFGNVSGYVYEYGTTNPIANAQVVIGGKTATSNSSGFYQINNLLVGSYGGNCSTPGMDYFSESVSGIVVTEGSTFNQNFYLKWAELAVNANQFTANLYLGQTDNQTLTISNPGGTADLEYDWYYLPTNRVPASNDPGLTPQRAVSPDPAHAVPELPVAETRVAVNGWLRYGPAQDAAYYTDYVTERATKFTLSDWGLWSDSGVTVSQLETFFYNSSADPWGTEDTFVFKIYGADGSTLLHTSPTLTAIAQTTTFNPTTYTLATPLTINSDFYVAVVPEGTTSGKPFGMSTDYSYGCSFYGSAGAWTGLGEEEHIISAFVDGNWWVYATPGTGVVPPTESENININFDTTDLSVGTYQCLLTIVNNSDYIAPSGRGDDLVIPLTLNVLSGGTTGNVQGHVYLAGTSTPVADAMVSLPYYDPVFTDATGFYSFTGVVGENNTTIDASAWGCQDYSGALAVQGGQTITRDIYLDYSEFSTPQTNYTLNCYLGETVSTTTTLANTGTWAVDWEAESGIWDGPTYNAGPLNEDFEDSSISGWRGLVGPNSAIYSGYAHNSSKTWVFASEGSSQPQYIISPMLKATAASNLSFWYQQFNDSNEVLKVMISRTDTAIGSFVDFATINMTTANHQIWTQYSASLADYAEEDHIYVCFYYPRTDGYQYGYVMIDDIMGPDVFLPYSGWLSSTPDGTLAAGASSPFTLTANSTGLPEGTYTAQTWVFGNAINEPYKVYVTLNVSAQPQSLDPPQNLVIAEYGTYVELVWDLVDNASGYHVYCSDDPYGTYQHLLFTADTYAEFTWAEIQALGISADRAFFHVTADTSAPRSLTVMSKSKHSSPTLDMYHTPRSYKTLKTSEQ